MNVFVTGGSGLVGSHVVELLRGKGHTVFCLQRPSSDTTHLRSLGCRITFGDLRDDPDQLAAAMDGCGALVHSAALVYPRVSRSTLHDVNVEGTHRVLRAAELVGMRRVVHLSSVAVYGDSTGSGSRTRRASGASSGYARSKVEAENVAMRAHRASDMEVCILRPAGVYGERDRGLTPTLASLVRFPVTPLLGTGRRPVPLVYAGNVATAVVLALRASGVGGEVFDVGEDDPVGQREALRALARGMGVRPRFVSVPVWLAEGAARIWDEVGRRLLGGDGASVLRLIRLATRGNPFSSSKLRRRLGWRPHIRSAEALERTGRWVRTESNGRPETGRRSGESKEWRVAETGRRRRGRSDGSRTERGEEKEEGETREVQEAEGNEGGGR